MFRLRRFVVWLWLIVPLGILVVSQLGFHGGELDWRQKLVTSLPDDESAVLGLVDALHAAGRDLEALEHVERLVQLEPKSERGHKALLALYGALGRGDDARNEVDRLIDLGIADAPDLVSAGAAVQAENLVLAIEYYRHALTVDPNYLEGNINLGAALVESRDWRAARTYLQRALSVSPQNVHAHINLGILERRTGRPRRAIAHFEVALKSEPSHAVIRELLASTKMQLARAEKSRQKTPKRD